MPLSCRYLLRDGIWDGPTPTLPSAPSWSWKPRVIAVLPSPATRRCGNACVGKTTTARLLAQRLPLAAHVEGDKMQRLIVSGCRWAAPSDSDPGTGRLTGEAGVQYALAHPQRVPGRRRVRGRRDYGHRHRHDHQRRIRVARRGSWAAGRSTSSCSALLSRSCGSAGLTGCSRKPRIWPTATATQITPRPQSSPAGSRLPPSADRQRV
jgi:hypothetical protein